MHLFKAVAVAVCAAVLAFAFTALPAAGDTTTIDTTVTTSVVTADTVLVIDTATVNGVPSEVPADWQQVPAIDVDDLFVATAREGWPYRGCLVSIAIAVCASGIVYLILR